MLIRQFYLKLSVGQSFEDRTFNLNDVFLRQVNTSLWFAQGLCVSLSLFKRVVKGVQQPFQLIVRRKLFHPHPRIGRAQMPAVFPLRPFQRAYLTIRNPGKAAFYPDYQIKALGIPPGGLFYDTAFYDFHVQPP